jgi:hypothetical protein
VPDFDPTLLASLFKFDLSKLTYDPKTARVGDWICRESPDMPTLTGKTRFHHGTVYQTRRRVDVFDLQLTGYRIVPFEEFADGKPVFLVRRGLVGQEHAVVLRILMMIRRRRRWLPVGWNCEDAAAHAHDGKSRGKQGAEEVAAFAKLLIETMQEAE